MDTTTLVPVLVGACLCPGAPHEDGDIVYLRPKLGLAAGIAVQKLVVDANQASEPMTTADLTGVLAEGYLLHGVAEWTFENEAGHVPVNPSTIKAYLLDDFERGATAADKADELYMGPVLAPLVIRAQALEESLRATSTNGSTSATRGGTPKPRKRSKPSSITTIPMDDTVAISG